MSDGEEWRLPPWRELSQLHSSVRPLSAGTPARLEGRQGRSSGWCNKDSPESGLLYCQQVYKLPRADVLNIIVMLEQGWNSTSGCNNTVGKVTARMFLLAAPAERTVQIISTVVRGLTVKLYQTRENQTKISLNVTPRRFVLNCIKLYC